ncbi:SDR family NAD(P)-dependent oxidoreductase [Actinomadura sp. KC06]|uniref:type I polyketide synthase n=1 Tax=Actinomadura sp. KC06 TaxID=2530369 RepID=UPI001050C229|nr:type I polyketide synthase [Actinomadura sp. KC06]TDD30912.1 SDR family NAD(P)-dependent oxidoreductase [Actinomadura sp. KC06]
MNETAADTTAADGTAMDAWPPPGAVPVDTADFYSRLADRGFRYGPAFRGLRAAWSRGEEIFAEVALDGALGGAAASYLLHPALFDGALHTTLLPSRDGQDAPRLPFVWRGVRLQNSGARRLRVRMAPDGDNAVSLTVTDDEGREVASVASLALRPLGGGQADGAALLRLAWNAVPRTQAAAGDTRPLAFLGTDHLGVTGALKAASRRVDVHPSLRSLDEGLRAGGDAVPGAVLVSCTDEAAEVRAATQRALVLIQEWLADARLADVRLVFVTRGAVAVRDGHDVPDLAGAAVWGMVRAAQAEHPGRFALVDLDDAGSAGPALVSAVSAGEPQLAVRDGGLLRPRLVRCPPAASGAASRWDPDGTVLITGGLGALGAHVARHLVRSGRTRRLVLLGRRGADTAGAAELAEEIAALGGHAEIAACDAADRAALARVIAAIPDRHPLTAVVHAAGAVDDGTVAALTPRRFDRVLRPKADAALNLHELTRDLPGCELILFSSVSGTLGGAGQANYAAANAFLDALAHRRKALGLPGASLAWGLWEGGMAGGLGTADLTRLRRSGLAALTAEQGLALLDAAAGHDLAVVAPVRLDEDVLREGPGSLPALLLDLAGPGRASRPREAPELREHLARLDGPEREEAVVAFVRGQVAAVLGHGSADDVDPAREFGELGLDSLTTVELNRRLAAATGLRLPATVAFDHPSAAALAGHLHRLLT